MRTRFPYEAPQSLVIGSFKCIRLSRALGFRKQLLPRCRVNAFFTCRHGAAAMHALFQCDANAAVFVESWAVLVGQLAKAQSVSGCG